MDLHAVPGCIAALAWHCLLLKRQAAKPAAQPRTNGLVIAVDEVRDGFNHAILQQGERIDGWGLRWTRLSGSALVGS